MSANLTDFIVIGDIYIINGDTDKKVYNKADVPNVKATIKDITSFKNKLKNEVTNTVKPGIIHRPTPGELLAKDEPEIKKQADHALRDTLDQVPQLRQAREFLESQK